MKQIPYLHKGSKIAIAAPARMVTPDEMQYAINWLKEKGFIPVFNDRLFAQHYIFAGDDDFRAAAFQEYLDNENIDAIWLARGGYGSIRIIDRLDFTKFLEHPKWIIGFSDGTVLHAKLNLLGVPSLHSSMPFYFENKTPEAKQALFDALLGKPLQYEIPSNTLNRMGLMEGEIIGGNLSVMYGMMGSNTFPEVDGKILFIEEVGESMHNIDRQMRILQMNGVLDRCNGIVLGEFSDCGTEFTYENVEAMIRQIVEPYGIPMLCGFPGGHGDVNLPLVMGAPVTIDVRNDGATLQFNISGEQYSASTADVTATPTPVGVRMQLAGKKN